MSPLSFLKVQGAGNDFVLLDGRELPGSGLSPQQAVSLCDRHYGIGADGVLVLTGDVGGIPSMRIFNADGSVAQMCGNGLRCFALAMRNHFGFQQAPLPVLTDAGPMVCHIDGSGAEAQVTIDMGAITTASGGALQLPLVPEMVLGSGEDVALYRVATGNPHAVRIGETTEEARQRLGPPLSVHPHFPEGTNVEFLTIEGPLALTVVVCERGVGFTLACGTGAVAATAVAVATGHCPADQWIDVALPGGELRVRVAADFSKASLQGPAVEVFRGVVELQES
jgi:diaminopimelate epimerase